jgi:hypothetical protein
MISLFVRYYGIVSAEFRNICVDAISYMRKAILNREESAEEDGQS